MLPRCLSQLSKPAVRRLRQYSTARAQRGSSGQPQAFRPVPIKVISVGKGSSSATEAAADEWAAKIRRYTHLSEVQVKGNPKRASKPDVIIANEGERVLKLIGPQDEVIVLDERGRDITSHGLAELIAKADGRGASTLVFCVGGPFGHAKPVRERADQTLRLSSLVLNHQVALVVLLEALYRSYTILKGHPYHH